MRGDRFQAKGKPTPEVLHLQARPPWEYPIPHLRLQLSYRRRDVPIYTPAVQVTGLTGHHGESPRKIFSTQGNVNTIVVESRDT